MQMLEPLQQLLQIGIVGVALSLVVEIIKIQYETKPAITKLITIGLAVGLGTAYWFLVGTSIWEAFIGILSAATLVYAFLLKE